MYDDISQSHLEDTETIVMVGEVWDEMQGPVHVPVEVLDSHAQDQIRAISDLQQDIEERLDTCEVIPWELRMDLWGGVVEFDPQRDGPRMLRSLAGRLASDPSGAHPDVADIVDRIRRLAERVIEIQ